jgi:hypothetical protein
VARVAAALAAVLAALACAACAGESGDEAPAATLEPLSTLGPLEPSPPPGELGGELVPIPDAPPLAPAASKATPDEDVDGIRCERNARLVFHVHVHLTAFVDGEQRAIPAGVGVWPKIGPENYRPSPIGPQFGETADNCLSWLSTRYADGLVHVESSEERSFTLGDFFAVWGQPLGPDRVGPAEGEVTAIVNREVWTGDPADIPLNAHDQISLQVGKPLVDPSRIEFPGAF